MVYEVVVIPGRRGAPPCGVSFRKGTNGSRGYTIVELMVTIVIVSVLAVSVGVFFVKLLNIQEHEREEAYVREKLADICGEYADKLSIGSSIINTSTNATIVKYRQETGGVSLETGLVTRVAYLSSLLNSTNDTVDMNIFSIENRDLSRKIARSARGDAHLLPLVGDMVSCTFTPLKTSTSTLNVETMNDTDAGMCAKMVPHAVFEATDAALGWLQVTARYRVKNDKGELETKTATAGRVVRLWNRE